MVRLNILLVTLLIATLGIAAPTATVFWLAGQQGVDAEKTRAAAYASEVLVKTEATLGEFTKVASRLSPMIVGDPCDPENLNLMEYASLSSADIKTLGYIANNSLQCSTLNIPDRAFDMGTADFVLETTPPIAIRTGVYIPRTGDLEFVAFEQSGVSALIQAGNPLDVVTESDDIDLAVFGANLEKPLFGAGNVASDWRQFLPAEGGVASFVQGNAVIAAARSMQYDLVAVARLPLANLRHQSRELLSYLLPVGFIAGAIVVWAIIYLSRHQMAMPQAIKAGLRRGEFYLVYQPIVELETGRWVGAEALMRWKRSNGEIISPDIFMTAAEASGLIGSMTERLIELVEKDAGKLFEASEDFHISLNLAADDIHDPRVVARLKTLKLACNAQPGQFFVEVTERGLTRPEAAIDVIRQLREADIPVAVDDFGTGYSSLSYLESFDLDFLKIDKFFVDSIDADKSSATSLVLVHIIEMAKSLQLGTIAEGVESESQRAMLASYGVQFAQGWLFSKPLSPDVLAKRLKERVALPEVA